MPDGTTSQLILEEARDQRAKQDGELRSLLRLATGALIVVLSAGAIAVTVSQDLAPHAAVVVFGTALLLGLNLVTIEVVAHSWQVGPGIDGLITLYRRRRPDSQQLQVALVGWLRRDYYHNDKTLRRIRYLVVLQTLIAFTGILVLLLSFYELT